MMSAAEPGSTTSGNETFARLADRGDVVAIVGAGGKTTTMFALAAALTARGLTVVTTKSTVIHRPTFARGPRAVVIPQHRWAGELPDLLRAERVLTVVVAQPSERRWDGVPPEAAFDLLKASGADVVIVEADGARSRLLKAPADHEPAMPPTASVVLPVASLLALGRPLSPRHVHRPERVTALLGIGLDETVSADHIARLLLHPNGGLKSAPAGARVWPVLARVDTAGRADVERILRALGRHPRVSGWVTASGADGAWRYAATARINLDT